MKLYHYFTLLVAMSEIQRKFCNAGQIWYETKNSTLFRIKVNQLKPGELYLLNNINQLKPGELYLLNNINSKSETSHHLIQTVSCDVLRHISG